MQHSSKILLRGVEGTIINKDAGNLLICLTVLEAIGCENNDLVSTELDAHDGVIIIPYVLRSRNIDLGKDGSGKIAVLFGIDSGIYNNDGGREED